MESSSFLSLSSIEEENKCFICNKTFGRKDKIHCFGVNGCPKFKKQAEKWSKLKTHKDDNEYVHTLVHSKLNDTGEPFGREFEFKIFKQCDKIWREQSHRKR